MFVKGKTQAELTVSSDCEDTCFYMRIRMTKGQGLRLKRWFKSLCFRHRDDAPNSKAKLNFFFDDHAFLIKKGERLRIDIPSADNAHFVRHTNQKGLCSKQATCKIAENIVFLDESFLELPVE